MNYIRQISYATLVALMAVMNANGKNHKEKLELALASLEKESHVERQNGQSQLDYINSVLEKPYNQKLNKNLWEAINELYHVLNKNKEIQTLRDAMIVTMHDKLESDKTATRNPLVLAGVHVDGITNSLLDRHTDTSSNQGSEFFESELPKLSDVTAPFANKDACIEALEQVNTLLNDKTSWFFFSTPATAIEVAQAGLILAGCVRKLNNTSAGVCNDAIKLFIEKFNTLTETAIGQCDALVQSQDKTKINDHSNYLGQVIHSMLLRSARVLSRATIANSYKVGDFNPDELSPGRIAKLSTTIKAQIRHLVGTQGEQGDGPIWLWATKNPFDDVMQALKGLDAEHGDKIESLKTLGELASRINSIVTEKGEAAAEDAAIITQLIATTLKKVRAIFTTAEEVTNYIGLDEGRKNNITSYVGQVRLAFSVRKKIQESLSGKDGHRLNELKELLEVLYRASDRLVIN